MGGMRRDQEREDAARSEADMGAYRAAWGHVERRHARARWGAWLAQAAVYVVGGLVMAVGFHPFWAFVATVLVARAIADGRMAAAVGDRLRRMSAGVD